MLQLAGFIVRLVPLIVLALCLWYVLGQSHANIENLMNHLQVPQ